MKQKFIDLYMAWAERAAQLSHAERLKVGAVIVKDDSVISYGYNGMPAGWDNNCENKVFNTIFKQQSDGSWMDPLTYQKVNIDEIYPYEEQSDEDSAVIGRYGLKTKPEVLHAEMNSLMKLARSTNSGNQASMFITHSPCLECAKGIYQAGIKEVFYGENYRSEDGIVFLKKCGIKIEKIIKDDKSNGYYSRRL